ncbi:putative HSP20-like chaperone [Seiridium unicorne]|uniref:HSP20-like chaperone n=1 Tax=Seiridium unicorne TaxID=138068 RepID=A0ABR2V4W6_9PEZI
MASFFRPHHYYNVPEPNFQGLFRLIDDFDRYSTQSNGTNGQSRQSRNNVSFFNPKFDMIESETAYELHGELPGLAKEDVHIEFTDPQTLQIRGKVERTHTAGSPPAGLIDGKPEMSGALTEAGDEHAETSSVKSQSHHATVEDDPEEKSNVASSQSTPQDTPASTVVEAAKSEKPRQESPKHKYYLVERNIGSFARSFNFPSRIDNDSVQASLHNGILTITVQKAKKHESRRIAIN